MTMFSPDGPRAVVFDVDGTLIDTEDVLIQATRYAIRRHLTRQFTDEELWALYGRPSREVWQALSPEHAADLHRSYVEFYERHRQELVRPFPGVQETVAELARRGVRLAVLSNKMRVTGAVELETAGLDGAFAVVAFVEDLPQPKPDARGLVAVLERLGVPPQRALMVGDGPMDILCGKGAGVPTAAALWARQAQRQRAALEQLGPDYLLTDLRQILTLFPAE